MKRSKFLFLALLFPVLISNSPAPIPYFDRNEHYTNYQIKSVERVEKINDPESGEEFDLNTPLYTFTIYNYGSYVMDNSIIFVIDDKYEIDIPLYETGVEYILCEETKELTFDFYRYFERYGEFEITLDNISATEAVAHRYNEIRLTEYRINNYYQTGIEGEKVTSFDLTFSGLTKYISVWYLGIEYSLLDENNELVNHVLSIPIHTYNKDNTIRVKFALKGEINISDLKNLTLAIYEDEHIFNYNPGGMPFPLKLLLIFIATILTISIIGALIVLIVNFLSTRRAKELKKETKEKEREKVRLKKEEKRKNKEAKKEKKRLEKEIRKNSNIDNNNNSNDVIITSIDEEDNN